MYIYIYSSETCNDLVFEFSYSSKDLDPCAHLLYNRVAAVRRVVTKYKGYHTHVSSLINEYSDQGDNVKEAQGPVSMLVKQFREMGYTLGGNMILHDA